ncbi:MAG: T9SS type A sorting domain-containing protein [Candidatus Firestonebacteria bacterium]
MKKDMVITYLRVISAVLLIGMGGYASSSDSFNIVVGVSVTPMVSEVSPTTGTNAILTTVTIKGLYFYGGTAISDVSQVKLSNSHFGGIGNEVMFHDSVISDTSIKLAVIPAGIAAGTYDVQVTTSAGTNTTSAMKFIVTSALLPTVTNISPSVSSGDIEIVISPNTEYNFKNTSQTTVAIYGTEFYGETGSPDVTQIKLDDASNTDVSFAQSTISDTTINNAVIPEGVLPGVYNVKVTTHAGTNLISEVKYTVINKINILVPTNLFSDVVTMTVSSNGVSIPKSDRDRIKTTNVGVEIKADKDLPLQKMLTITLEYKDTDVAGLDETKLVIGRYDDIHKRWVLLQSTSYPELNKVVGVTNHLSKFAILQLLPALNLGSAKVYPNPFNPNKPPYILIFDNLTQNAIIKIYLITGELIREIVDNNGDGRESWDGKNNGGKDVASGIYLAVVKDGSNIKRIKIAIER